MLMHSKQIFGSWSATPRKENPNKGSVSVKDPNSGDGFNRSMSVKSKSGIFASPETRQDLSDMEGLSEKYEMLLKEHYDYQYNMGLLLLEKENWASVNEKMKEELEKTKGALELQQTAHSDALSELEKKEEELKRVLGVEKQCVIDLEKALHDLRAEQAEIKFASASKLSKANTLVRSIEERSLEVEAKVHETEAKLAETNRKSSEIDRKILEVEFRENELRKERMAFITEKQGIDRALLEQRDELRQWEKKLNDGEERIAQGYGIINQREQKIIERDQILNKKENEIQETQKKLDELNLILKGKETEMTCSEERILLKEKGIDVTIKSLDVKEKELTALEEKLNAKEKIGMQELLDEQKKSLELRRLEFEAELEEERKASHEELKVRASEVEKKAAELNHLEQKFAKSEQSLQTKVEKLKEKEKDVESKLKSIKEREKNIKIEEKNVGMEKKQLALDKDDLISLKESVGKMKVDLDEEKQRIEAEKDELRVTAEERIEFSRMQTELKRELEGWRHQKELVLNESEELKQERLHFERQWELLDSKNVALKKEQEYLNDQKEKLERLHRCEEERLDNEKIATREQVRRDVEALKLEKQTHMASMELERTIMAEKMENERSQVARDFEERRRELEADLEKKREEMEMDLEQKKQFFIDEKALALAGINRLREETRLDLEEVKRERLRLEKDAEEVISNKKHLEEQQHEIRKDSEELIILSRKLKAQREEFIKGRERFVSDVENHRTCSNCGTVIAYTPLVSNLTENEENDILLKSTEDGLRGVHADIENSERRRTDESPVQLISGSPPSGATASWIRKCTSKLFSFPSVRKGSPPVFEGRVEKNVVSTKRTSVNEPPVEYTSGENEEENGEDRPFQDGEDSFEVQRIPSDISAPSTDDHPDVNRAAGTGGIEGSGADDHGNQSASVLEDSEHGDVENGKVRRKGRVRVNRRPTKESGIGDGNGVAGQGHGEGALLQSQKADAGVHSRENLDQKKGVVTRGRKRNYTARVQVSERDGDGDEVSSDGVSRAPSRKKIQKAPPPVESHGERRYNLRRPKPKTNVVRNVNEKKPANNAKPVSSVEVRRVENGSRNSTHLQGEGGEEEEEEGGTKQGGDGREESGSRLWSDREEESGSEEEETGGEGEASVGKKIWKFLTT